ncbi:EH domain-binding protein 1 isoform X3 [Pieris brassicae]|uniref:EH domain-binding protein 1 isoform X3 n=1 Tax=Pieris brassicae TaxID=7116 RepID=UPI001E65E67A|nr:EH domain-binding protein 1 isoform X3 [Pieris brassicae]
MASVWKRLQRVNKRAAKFQYTASYHQIELDLTPKWKPNKLSIVWTRRSRRVVTDPLEWEPSLKDPLKGSVIFGVENHTVAVTLFRDSRTNELEDKDWTFVLEDVSVTGKRRRLASCAVNLRKHASLAPAQKPLKFTLEPLTKKLKGARLHLTLHCVLLREGQATDEDMQSLASLLSVNNNSDIAVLEDLDEDDYTLSDSSTRQMLDLRQQMEEMTQSLTNSDIAATPNSVQSLNFDKTPTAQSPTTPVNAVDAFGEDAVTPKNRPEYLSSLTKAMRAEPKFSSTPKPVLAPSEEKIDNLKVTGLVFKPKTIAKRNLKPLELKTNLNNISLDTNDNEKQDQKTPVPEERLTVPHVEKDKTPMVDLVEWCQYITREYPRCPVTDLTTSFRSGLTFCAIIHHFRPDLIDFSGLQPDESEENVRRALEASVKLGISQVLTVADVCGGPVPDKLAVMTYLFQLRAYFTGNELQVEQLGNDETESSYLVGRHDTDDSLPPELFSREVSTRRSRNVMDRPPVLKQDSQESRQSLDLSPDKSPAIKDMKDIFQQSKNILGKMLSPAKDLREKPTAKWFNEPIKTEPLPRPEKLMTRKELTDPFGSDDEEEAPPANDINNSIVQSEQKPSIEPAATDPLNVSQTQPNDKFKPPTPELPKPTPGMSEEERQNMLRERARKIIADARAGIVSPKSPMSPSRINPGTVEIISKHSVLEELAAGGMEHLESLVNRESAPSSPGSRKSNPSPERNAETKEGKSRSQSPNDSRKSPLHSFSALVDRLSPEPNMEDNENKESYSTYIASELQALEREQKSIDEKAAALEKQLRRVMDRADNTEEEDRLMSQWFNLVNKKNALIRRQMQLNILEKEEDLSRRCELLARELRLSLGVEEWRKTPGQKRREILLLQDLLSAVNERDRLVQEMDEQEKAIAEDDEIQRNLSNVEIRRPNNCLLQ